MAQTGQTTPSGGRTWPVGNLGGPMRRVNVPVGCTVNHIGGWFWEQVTAGEHDARAAIYSTAGALLYESSILTAPISSTSTPQLAQFPFTGASLTAGDYDLGVSAEDTPNLLIMNGQNGTAGLPIAFNTDPDSNFPDFQADIAGHTDTTAARQWDLYLDYTEASSGRPAVLAQLQTNGEPFL